MVSSTRDESEKACPHRAGFLFGQFENSITDGSTYHIQDQIVNVTAAQQGKKLRQLHSGDNQAGGQHGAPEFLKLWVHPGQKEAQGNEHDHITTQIDQGGGAISLLVQNVQKKTNGVEGFQIQICLDLRPVVHAFDTAGAVEKKVQHESAVKTEQNHMQFPVFRFHGGTSFRHFGAL